MFLLPKPIKVSFHLAQTILHKTSCIMIETARVNIILYLALQHAYFFLIYFKKVCLFLINLFYVQSSNLFEISNKMLSGLIIRQADASRTQDIVIFSLLEKTRKMRTSHLPFAVILSDMIFRKSFLNPCSNSGRSYYLQWLIRQWSGTYHWITITIVKCTYEARQEGIQKDLWALVKKGLSWIIKQRIAFSQVILHVTHFRKLGWQMVRRKWSSLFMREEAL